MYDSEGKINLEEPHAKSLTMCEGGQKTTPRQRVNIYIEAVDSRTLPITFPMDGAEFLDHLAWIANIVDVNGEKHLPQAWIEKFGKSK
jgi:hypothetical protein